MLYYSEAPGATQSTNASANTTNDCYFMSPGSARAFWFTALFLQGRSTSVTAITGISLRMEKWTSTASTGGTSLTPTPDDEGYQAAKHSSGWSASAVTPGTGGPTLQLSIGCGIASPGIWQARQIDEAPMLQAGETKSLDLFNISGGSSLPFELSLKTWE